MVVRVVVVARWIKIKKVLMLAPPAAAQALWWCMLTFSRVIFLFFSDGELLYISQPPVSVGHHLGRRRNMMERRRKNRWRWRESGEMRIDKKSGRGANSKWRARIYFSNKKIWWPSAERSSSSFFCSTKRLTQITGLKVMTGLAAAAAALAWSSYSW
jgi:hypothetical protein